jgi:PPM family protein phosphatase
MKVSPGNAQHIGDRSEQQDSFGFTDPDNVAFAAHAGVAAVVADGMGGLANGGAASAAAVQAFLNAYEAKRPAEPIPDALLRSIRAANEAVMSLWRKTGTEGSLGSTLAAVALHGDRLYWVSAGDSRVYLYRDRHLVRLTTDHVYAAELEEQVGQGRISREQASLHPDRNALTSYLGLENLPLVDRSVRAFPVKPGDSVLLCSDGLYRALPEEEIAAALEKDSRKSCETLVHRAIGKRMSGQDNITAIALRCREDSSVPRFLKPAPIAAVAALAALGFLLWRESAPTISLFAVDRARIYAGQSAVLQWSVDKGSVTITPGLGTMVQNTGTRSVSPPRTMRYTLVARNAFGMDRRSVDVDVVPAPQIAAPAVLPAKPPETPAKPTPPQPAPARQAVVARFTASPNRIAAGRSALLQWSVRNTAAIRIDPLPGAAPLKASGSQRVNPVATTTYTLTATGGGKPAVAKVTVSVSPAQGRPVRIHFVTNQTEIAPGDAATLKWTITGEVQSVAIDNGLGPVDTSGSMVVSPSVTTTYTLRANERGGAALTASVTVDVLPPPRIEVFEAFNDGQVWRLRWHVAGTDRAGTRVVIDPDIGAVAASSPDGGLALKSPPAGQYTLTAEGPGGKVSKQVAVQPQPPGLW